MAAVAVLLLRWLLDARRARQVLAALRKDTLQALPQRAGRPWGELSQRIVKLLREREQRLAQSDARLQEFLIALEDSPNGVVLLDDKGRIEWCNQTAARHWCATPSSPPTWPPGTTAATWC
jgi:two-component system phosphate regulon sensor histidine kinase PhoR